jgi:hypothetical protein
LIELLPSTYRHPAGFIYASLAGCKYGALVCECTGRGQSVDITVDLVQLESMIGEVLAES